MSQRKAYATRLNMYEAEALTIASEVWPEHADNGAELLRAIINTWRRDRDNGGGKTHKIVACIEQAKYEIIAEIRRIGEADHG